MLKVLLVIILGMVIFSGRGFSQEDYIGMATNALQDVLSNLQQSVQKLTIDNDQLANRDNAMKQQVSQLQAQLGNLEAQEDLLKKSASQLSGNNPRRAQQIEHLEEENSELDHHIQKTEGDIQLIQQSLDAVYKENAKGPSPEYQSDERRQKEKLKLMKMIYESQQRQETLHEAIREFQKNTPSPQPSDSALAHQQDLKEKIKSLEDEAAAYPSDQPSADSGPAGQWDDAQTRQLEMELTVLEKNYMQLKELMAEMDQKAKATKLTVSQRIEEEKLQHSLSDLNHQGVELSRDLNKLRSQMVDLDKRKSRLESMIHHLP